MTNRPTTDTLVTPKSAKEPRSRQRCKICGRFMRQVGSDHYPEWRCPKVWYNGEGGWEHD